MLRWNKDLQIPACNAFHPYDQSAVLNLRAYSTVSNFTFLDLFILLFCFFLAVETVRLTACICLGRKQSLSAAPSSHERNQTASYSCKRKQALRGVAVD